jgi:hypothetical protein
LKQRFFLFLNIAFCFHYPQTLLTGENIANPPNFFLVVNEHTVI